MKTFIALPLLMAVAATPALAADPPTHPAAASSTADPAALQREMDQLSQRMNHLAQRMAAAYPHAGDGGSRAYAFRYLADPDRGMLGLVLKPADRGLEVVALTPGSPAEKAGIGAGDVITSVDGKAVTTSGKLHDLGALEKVKAGDSVKLGLLHEGKPRLATVKAERREALGWAGVMMPPPLSRTQIADIERTAESARKQAMASMPWVGRERVVLRQMAPWWGLNLAPLEGDLGSYFGTQSGALVLSSAPKRYPGLKAGDVITAIDGNTIARPEDVMRSLRDRKEGSTVRLAVRRHGKQVDVRMKTPSLELLLPPAPPAPPAAPSAPSAVAPPLPPPAPAAPPAPRAPADRGA